MIWQECTGGRQSLTARSKYNYIAANKTAAPDIVYDINDHNSQLQAERSVLFDKQLSRYKQKNKVSAMSTPYYNPNLDIVKLRRDAGVPLFDK